MLKLHTMKYSDTRHFENVELFCYIRIYFQEALLIAMQTLLDYTAWNGASDLPLSMQHLVLDRLVHLIMWSHQSTCDTILSGSLTPSTYLKLKEHTKHWPQYKRLPAMVVTPRSHKQREDHRNTGFNHSLVHKKYSNTWLQNRLQVPGFLCVYLVN